jgi:CxxC motif-containing protein (DUF1111 family)
VLFKLSLDGTRDGGVHNTATVKGRAGAIVANQSADSFTKGQFGIGGHPNRIRPGLMTGQTNNNGNDGTIARFGWKAQNQSLLLFSGEAYNVEMGISNELFQQEREQKTSCQFATVPNDATDTLITTTPDGLNAIEKFAFFQRFLAPPTPSATSPGGAFSINNGRNVFTNTGCALCHTPAFVTGNSTVAALRNKTAQPVLRPPGPQHGPGSRRRSFRPAQGS